MGCRRAYSLLAAAVVAAAVLAGCGGTSPEQQVRATLQRFGQAVATHNYKLICDQLLATQLTDRLTAVGLPCTTGLARGFGAAKNPKLTVRNVNVKGSHATATVHTTATNQKPSNDSVGLVKAGSEWRIASVDGS